ncbi:MAG: HAMP domain-containing sensor histidine kinase [Paracoccaceae bacterium]|nr:HAMP domain-containing sensor histidine kinase [Paracoccaceae bacterium]
MTIRRKISVLLLVLASVITFRALDRVDYMRKSSAQFLSLSERAIVGLDSMEALISASAALRDIILELSDARSAEEVSALRERLDRLVSSANSAAFAIGGDGAVAHAVSARLAEAREAALIELAARENLIANTAQGERVASRLDQAAALLGALSASGDSAALRSSTPEDASSVISTTIADEYIMQIELGALLSRLQDMLNGTSLEMTPRLQGDLARQTEKVLAAARASARPSDGLAATLTELLDVLTGPAGLAEWTEEARQIRLASDTAADDASAALYDAVTAISIAVQASEKKLSEVYQATAAHARRTAFPELVLSGGMGLGIVIAVWLVFSRQISRRLEILSEDVLRVAGGDPEPPVSEPGRDEIGRMAAALEIFRQNARELSRSNEDLANFAYVASHDLRTPLRAIRDLVDWTIEDAGDGLEPGARANLDLIRTRAERLSRLLADLLDYARAGDEATPPALVDVESMVSDIAELVDQSGAFGIRFSGLGRIKTYETPLRTILLNLIGNAVKHHDQPQGRIDVSAHLDGARAVISISDDGPGIERRYQSKVFDLFQTLQSRDQHDSSGLGLAMVKKLVDRLEGEIALSSNPVHRRGSVFTLRIPLSGIDGAAGQEGAGEAEGRAA